MGAVWKFSNSEQSVSSLSAIPHEVWLAMSVIELLCALGLIIPAFKKSLASLVPTAALIIAGEMLLFCGFHLFSGEADHSPMFYWLVVATISAFVSYGRFVWKPIK
jgi:hypothetical protein